MAVPKKKISVSRRGQRNAHKHVKYSQMSACKSCGKEVRSHHICLHCGHYKDRQVKALKKIRRQQRQQEAA